MPDPKKRPKMTRKIAINHDELAAHFGLLIEMVAGRV
jgi:hypothetical protein